MARCSALEENLVEVHDVERFSHAPMAEARRQERVREPALGGRHRLERNSLALAWNVVPVEALIGAEGKAHLAFQLRSERAQELPGSLHHVVPGLVFLVSRGGKRERHREHESEEPSEPIEPVEPIQEESELHVHPPGGRAIRPIGLR